MYENKFLLSGEEGAEVAVSEMCATVSNGKE
jgi:hypothetical protein